MSANESSEATTLVQAVKTPLGFFVLVVLIVETILTAFVLKGDLGADQPFVIRAMIVLIFALVLIVALISILRPSALSGKERQLRENKYSLSIGPPENWRDLDINLINWDNEGCFLISGRSRQNVTLVRSQGPLVHVDIPPKLFEKVREEPVSLELKDKKGNRWEVRSFYLYENSRSLSLVETRAKIIQDYGEENQ